MASSSSTQRSGEHTPPLTRKKSYAMALVTPNKIDRIARLQTALNQVQEENRDLKTRLGALEARLQELESVAKLKATEVNQAISNMVTETQAQDLVSSIPHKVQTYVAAELRERRLQEDNSLKVRIGGLPTQWDASNIDYEDGLAALSEAIQPIQLDRKVVECISNKLNHDKKERIPSGHAIITFTTPEDRIRLLQQSRLLKGTSIWFAEELTPNQLKHKAQELKKMHKARQEGKWAVFRNGKAIIQEFRNPKRVAPPTDITPPIL